MKLFEERFLRSFHIGLACGASAIAGVTLHPFGVVFPVIFILLLPLLMFMYYEGGAFIAKPYMLLVLTELLFGGSGVWNGVPVRLMLAIGAFALLVLLALSRGRLRLPPNVSLVVGLGFFAPVMMLVLSVTKGAELGSAFADLNFLAYIALALPLFCLFAQDESSEATFCGFTTGSLLALSALLISTALVVAMLGYRPAFTGWFSGNLSFFPNGFPRITYNAHVLMLLGILLFFQFAFRDEIPTSVRRRFGLTAGAAVLALILTFSRALIIALIIVIWADVLLRLILYRLAGADLKKLSVLFAGATVAGILMATLSQGGAGRFLTVLDAKERANSVRATQAVHLLKAWQDHPITGVGYGRSTPSGYVRHKEKPYLYELTYHATLMKGGLVGLLVLLVIPVTASLRLLRSVRIRAASPRVLVLRALCCTVIAISIAGAFNPFMTSAYLSFLFSCMLAYSGRPKGIYANV
jgi:hypothetical protein